MTQNMNDTATTDEIYSAIAGNRQAHRLVNEIIRVTDVRPRNIPGRSHTTAREVERAERTNARHSAAILRFIDAVRAAKTEARVNSAIATLKRQLGLLDTATSPTALAAAIRNA